MARAAVQNPDNAGTIEALTELLWVMHRSRMMQQQGTPAMALVVHLVKTGPMRSSDLAGAMHLDQSTVSRHLAHLDTSGLITRSPDPHDGRAQLVEVTESGRQEVQTLIGSRVHDFEQVVDVWSASDRDDFARLLTRFSGQFAAQLSQRTDQPGPASTDEDAR